MMSVWNDVWAADVWSDIWAEFVQSQPSPLISGITLYTMLDGATAMIADLAATSPAIYPAMSGTPAVNEFVP